jgi:hypothetical protein
MHRSRLELEPGVWLDARRAVWLEESRVLAIADLHLGYAWAHRQDGNLLPVSAREDTVERLSALVENYAPREVALLGDIVHRAVLVPALQDELCRLFSSFEKLATLRLILGNHDGGLASLLRECGLNVTLLRELRAGPHLLLHGDLQQPNAANALINEAQERGGRILIGHEHPAISLGDGVASRVRCPCFVVGPQVLVLPAFSPWAAGTEIRARSGLSAFSREAAFERVVAILAGKLLPLPFPR